MQNKKFRSVHFVRTFLTIVAVAAMICGAVGGTLAYLSDKTDLVKNTFTYGQIDITLDETITIDGDQNPLTNSYAMVLGEVINKDPVVVVKAESENAYLFVKIEKSGGNIAYNGNTLGFDDFVTFEMGDGWSELSGVDGVWYRSVAKSTTDTEFDVIKDKKVYLNTNLTEDILRELKAAGESYYPVLKITAYAIQSDNIASVEEAWRLISE